MTDVHVHMERGPYTIEWIAEFVAYAKSNGINELHLLDHSYLFREFLPMYNGVRQKSDYIDKWLRRKAGVHVLDEYFRLIEAARACDFGLKIKFGIEICYLPDHIRHVEQLIKDTPLDFIVGSVHFIDNFAFDHKPEHWNGLDVDHLYRRFFEISVDLAETGIFNGLAHPDSVKLFGHTPSFALDTYYDSLAFALAKSNMYAEQNRGISRRTNAPSGMNHALYTAMKRYNVRIQTASDAHIPEDVGAGIKYFYDNNLI